MFRRWLSTAAMTFIAASLFLAPPTAAAQSLGLYGGYFGRPIYMSPVPVPAADAFYSPYGAAAFPFGAYGGYAGIAPAYGPIDPYRPAVVAAYSSYNYYQPFAYNPTMSTPVLTSGGASPALYSLTPALPTVGLPVAFAPPYYFRPVNYVGYPNYVYVPGSDVALPTYYANPLTYAPYPGMYSAYGMGPTTFAADVGLGGPPVRAPLRTETPAPEGSPSGIRNLMFSNTGRTGIRPALYPAVSLPAGDTLLRESVGATQTDQTAKMEVIVPKADAEVWFQGAKTSRTGTVREFVSPPLVEGNTYTYEVRARWAGGEPVTRTVRVRAGERVRVDFTAK